MSYVHMAGNVGNVPDMGTTKSGAPWARVRLAVTRWDFRTEQETTDWWTVKLYGKNAERASKILRPGTGVVFRGTPVQEEWTAKDGTPRRDIAIRADTFTVVRHVNRPDPLAPVALAAPSAP